MCCITDLSDGIRLSLRAALRQDGGDVRRIRDALTSVFDVSGEAPLMLAHTDGEVIPVVTWLQIPEQLVRLARPDRYAAFASTVALVPNHRRQRSLASVV